MDEIVDDDCSLQNMVEFFNMSLILQEIKSETLEILENQANMFGLSVDDYLRSLLPKTVNNLSLEGDLNDEFEADMIAFAEDSEGVANYNGTYSREDIYSDHD
jgi:hypothetical protein